jgi:hypothetical protein
LEQYKNKDLATLIKNQIIQNKQEEKLSKNEN